MRSETKYRPFAGPAPEPWGSSYEVHGLQVHKEKRGNAMNSQGVSGAKLPFVLSALVLVGVTAHSYGQESAADTDHQIKCCEPPRLEHYGPRCDLYEPGVEAEPFLPPLQQTAAVTPTSINAIGDFIGSPFSVDIFELGSNLVGGGGDDTRIKQASPFITRTFKIIEGQNARPQDRVFGSVNYFNNVGDVSDNQLVRYLIGFEKTFLDGRASFGMQLPFFTVDPAVATARGSGPPGTTTQVSQLGLGENMQSDVGDLTLIFKYALCYDECSLDTLSVGLAYTAPTASDTIADVDTFIDTEFDNEGALQPYVGFLKTIGDKWFAYGFSAIDVPLDDHDTTFWFNDLGIGYYHKRPGAGCITAIVPKLEIHFASPIENERLVFTIDDPQGASQNRTLSTRIIEDLGPVTDGFLQLHDQVNLTAGVTLELNETSTLTFGFVTPMAGPNPFNYELQLRLQVFGGGAAGPFGFGIF